jgi:thiol-disulfide isomerase/thioredoxin
VQARVQALVNLASLGEEQRFEESLSFLEKYESSDDETIATTAAELSRQVQMLFPQLLTEKQLANVMESMLEEPEESGLSRFNIGPLQNFAMQLDQYGLNKQAAALYERLAELGAKSDDERVSGYAETFKGAARRLRSEGKKLEVYGTTVTGDAFDWESYRGKVVLVDFWATWCGPCVAEIPNVKKQYEMYKDQGFDVVGVSQDDSAETVVSFLEKRDIPWTNLITNSARTPDGKVPLDVYYGVISIPRAILVDREGKVVSLDARGPKLEELLKELLGTPSTD